MGWKKFCRRILIFHKTSLQYLYYFDMNVFKKNLDLEIMHLCKFYLVKIPTCNVPHPFKGNLIWDVVSPFPVILHAEFLSKSAYTIPQNGLSKIISTFKYPAAQFSTALVFFNIIVSGMVSKSVTDPFRVPKAGNNPSS